MIVTRQATLADCEFVASLFDNEEYQLWFAENDTPVELWRERFVTYGNEGKHNLIIMDTLRRKSSGIGWLLYELDGDVCKLDIIVMRRDLVGTGLGYYAFGVFLSMLPDNVKKVSEIGEIKVDQCCIGSCTNSSLYDMLKVAAILKGKRVNPNVSLTISPGSMQVLGMLSECGALADILGAGARLLECACGPCIGMGQSPNSAGVSLRTFNRNFEGRSGTADAGVYLVSPEVAAASALTGVLTDPRTLGDAPVIHMPEKFVINDNLIDKPASVEEAKELEVIYGPNIKPVPNGDALPEDIEAPVVLKVGDNITTDHIMPAGAKILPYRSNIPFLSNFCFRQCDEDFAKHCKEAGKGIIIGGSNYGQGSSREHAALVPLYLGIKSVIAKSFARIHQANLINAGIVPFTFANPDDYDRIDKGDNLAVKGIRSTIENDGEAILVNETKGESYPLSFSFSGRQKDIILAGGLLNYTRESHK